MFTYYVMVTGPYDAKFVGPFAGFDTACEWIDRQTPTSPNFDFLVHSETEMLENMLKYGAVPITPSRD